MRTTRIRYLLKDEATRLYISSKAFQVNGKSYQVLLDEKNLKYNILNMNTNKMAMSGCSPDVKKLKKNARTALISLGVRFNKDVKRPNNKRTK